MKNFKFFTVLTLLLLATVTDCFSQVVTTTTTTTTTTSTGNGNSKSSNTLIGVEDPTRYGLPLNAGGYSKVNLEIVMGYVNKSCICKFPDGTSRIGCFFTDRRFLNGAQLGAVYTPSFDWGLGLRTGAFIEFYECHSPLIDKRFPEYNYVHFRENDLYLPLQGTYRIPFANDLDLTCIAGMGFQCAFSGRYMERTGQFWRWRGGWSYRHREIARQEYGNGGPRKANWQAEVGLKLRYKCLGFNFLYSFGLVDHHMKTNLDGCGQTYGEPSATFSRQDKMQVSISLNML